LPDTGSGSSDRFAASGWRWWIAVELLVGSVGILTLIVRRRREG
jgi:hypothetical protein